MTYNKTITLKDGRECVLRNGTDKDGAEVYRTFNQTHEETDYLLSYPDENSYTPEQEAEFLKKMTESDTGIEIVAEIGGKVVACAGIEAVGTKYKVRRRAEFGISVERDYWGLGIGRALTKACIECAEKAGFAQLELEAVAENDRAVALYKSEGFVEFGRNPRGFCSRFTGWQESVLMRLELD